jgi:hypothetical protein
MLIGHSYVKRLQCKHLMQQVAFDGWRFTEQLCHVGVPPFHYSDPFVLFSGGMPRASHGDRHTVTVMRGSEHVVFDLTSKIIDFTFISSSSLCGEGNWNALTNSANCCFNCCNFYLLLLIMLKRWLYL